MSTWQVKPLAELGTIIGGGTPSTDDDSLWGGEVAWVTPKDLSRNRSRYIGMGERSITRAGLAASAARMLPEGAVILSSRAPIGLTAIASAPLATNQGCKSFVAGPELHAPYVYYRLGMMTDQFEARATGSTFKEISGSRLGEVPFVYPDRDDQVAIADVLGALDDKISANGLLVDEIDLKLGAEFEQMLRSGVEFEPLGGVAVVNEAQVKPQLGSGLRYVDISSVGVGSFELPAVSDWALAPSRARRRLKRGDTVWSTVRPNRRAHALNLLDDPLLVASTGLAVLTPRDVSAEYLYQVTHRPEFGSYLESVAEGSAYPAVRAQRFEEAMIPMASDDDREAFQSIAQPLREAAAAAEAETRTLTALRNTLLPKLMSGELRVRDAEDLIDGATP